MQLDARPRRAAGVVSRSVDREMVLVHAGQNKVRALNPVGARLWQLADGSRSVADLARIIAGEYVVDLPQAEADAARFCRELAERGLLDLDA